MGGYQNPADFIIKFAQAPMLYNLDLNLNALSSTYDKEFRLQIDAQIKKDQDKFLMMSSTDFDKFAENRQVGIFTQFTQIFKRNWLYLLRNPRSLNGIFFSGMFTAILNLCLYWKVGDITDVNFFDPSSFIAWAYNMKGLAFLMSNNIAFSTSMGVILQMPLQVPVFKRETANKMYSSTTYFWGRYLSNIIVQLFYPISSVLFVFYGLDID